MNSIRPDLLATAIPVKIPSNVPEWVTEDMPPFFTDIADADRYIRDLEDQIQTLDPVIKSAKEFENGADITWHKFISAKRKYLQQIAITKISLQHAYPHLEPEKPDVVAVGPLKQKSEQLEAQVVSLKNKLSDLKVVVADVRNAARSAAAKAEKANEERIKLDTKMGKERKFYLRCIHAILTGDEQAKQRALESLSFLESVPDEWGLEDFEAQQKGVKS